MNANIPLPLLLVEDHDEFRTSLTYLLNSTGQFLCTAFGTAEEALAHFEVCMPLVVLMDIDLPGGMDGIRCTAEIKRRWPATQVMMCTVYEDDRKIFDALKAGATGYVLKRAPIEDLFEAIKQIRSGGSPMSASIARKVVGSFQVLPAENGHVLSSREVEVLAHLSEGLRYKEIADRLGMSINTVRAHVRHIYEKLQVQSRTEALNKAHWPRGGKPV